jgi:hypothetical protein
MEGSSHFVPASVIAVPVLATGHVVDCLPMRRNEAMCWQCSNANSSLWASLAGWVRQKRRWLFGTNRDGWVQQRIVKLWRHADSTPAHGFTAIRKVAILGREFTI